MIDEYIDSTDQKTKWLFVLISWVSWAWKATMIALFKKNNPEAHAVLSRKTRLLRPGEEDGVDYHYITEEEFKRSIDNNEFLEYAVVHQTSYYGTKKKDIEDALYNGKIIIKELDMQWVQKIAQDSPDLFARVCHIFLDVSDETIRERVLERAPTPEDEIQRRLHSAAMERELAKQYSSYIISAEPSIPDVYEAMRSAIQEYCDQKNILITIQ